MRTILLGLGLAALSMTACGDGNRTISLGDKTPAEASNEIADAICDYSAECGNVSLDCSGGPNGLDCTGVIEPVSYDECFAEVRPDVEEDLTECNLTDAEKKILETCLNAYLARPCITQAEVDAYVLAIEAGDETATLGEPPPPECAQLDGIFESCGS